MLTRDGIPERTVVAAGALRAQFDPQVQPLRVLITLTDEELLVLHDSTEPVGLDLPWISARERNGSGFSRREARLSATRSMVARGLLAPDSVLARVEGRPVVASPDSVTPNALLAGIQGRVVLSPLLVRVDAPLKDGAEIVNCYVDTDESTLIERVSPDGLHQFLMCSRDRARELLQERLTKFSAPAPGDEREAGSPRTVRTVVESDWDGLLSDSEVGPLLAAPTTRSRISTVHRPDGATDSALVVFSDDGAAVVVDAQTSTADGGASDPSAKLRAGTATRSDIRRLVDSVTEFRSEP
ncbi:hypothetical protein [Brachybacterium sp. ACRRE]|uniref:hypothetical protein n=1 Tax=Brachybacterium sp. ACRRE TaxID=2918184 RepID=UPI001EF1D0E3|nr:hypothetical protein [Brachybacterium sp. ACRRE]MCG7308568.1 hypothetical protein [Brachybacterium sp. ACRRE]